MVFFEISVSTFTAKTAPVSFTFFTKRIGPFHLRHFPMSRFESELYLNLIIKLRLPTATASDQFASLATPSRLSASPSHGALA
jgi:hypothetical protein